MATGLKKALAVLFVGMCGIAMPGHCLQAGQADAVVRTADIAAGGACQMSIKDAANMKKFVFNMDGGQGMESQPSKSWNLWQWLVALIILPPLLLTGMVFLFIFAMVMLALYFWVTAKRYGSGYSKVTPDPQPMSPGGQEVLGYKEVDVKIINEEKEGHDCRSDCENCRFK